MPSPPGTAIVVRGGVVRDAATLMEQLEDAVQIGDGAVLSVCVGEQLDSETFIEAVYTISEVGTIRHGKIQTATAQYLYEAGIDLVPDTSLGQAPNHHHAVFTQPLQLAQIEAFIRCFDMPMVNPTKGYRKVENP